MNFACFLRRRGGEGERHNLKLRNVDRIGLGESRMIVPMKLKRCDEWEIGNVLTNLQKNRSPSGYKIESIIQMCFIIERDQSEDFN